MQHRRYRLGRGTLRALVPPMEKSLRVGDAWVDPVRLAWLIGADSHDLLLGQTMQAASRRRMREIILGIHEVAALAVYTLPIGRAGQLIATFCRSLLSIGHLL